MTGHAPTARRYRRAMTTAYPDAQVRRLYSRDLHEEVAVLRQLVVDLMTEVEALRALQLERGPEEVAAYRRVYRRTALASHNSAGPWSGVHRVFWAWYGEEDPPAMTFGDLEDGVRRELALLRRMGATDEEVQQHMVEVEEHATRT